MRRAALPGRQRSEGVVRPRGLQMVPSAAFLPPPPAHPPRSERGVGEGACRGACQGACRGKGWGAEAAVPMLGFLQQLPAAAISCDVLRSLLFLSPLGSGRKVVVILPGGGCLAEVRSGVSGTVKFSGCSHGSGDKGKWELYPPPRHCGYQAAQEGASLLEKGSQTWADPLVLEFDS